MSDSLDEKVMYILEDEAEDFNRLSKEERERVYKFKRVQKIRDYWMFLTKYPDDTTKTYRTKIEKALRVLVANFYKDYRR